MGTIERDKGRTGRTKIKVQPSITVVGAPGIGKRKIANELAADYFTGELAVNEANPYVSGVALGLHADYRTELKIAADRATLLHSTEMPVLYTHSLIDSLAYALTRVDTQVTYGAGSESQRETWALTMGIIGLMLRDTFKADETIFLRAEFEADSDQDKLQEVLESVLEIYEFNYSIIDVSDPSLASEDVAKIIDAYIN